MRRIAQGRLSFERSGAATAVSQAYAESPLKLLTPQNHGDAAWAYLGTLGGGLLDGDRIRLDIELGRGARALVSTQGPTRVFRSPGGCESRTFARVGPGAALVLVPDPAACCAGARFLQRTEVDLEPGGSLALWDVLSAGRERWGFSQCTSALQLRRCGRPVLDDAFLLDAAHGALGERMGRFAALATLVLAGPLFEGARGSVRAAVEARAVAPGARLVESASPVGGDVLVVRLAAESVEELLRALRDHLSALPGLLGDDPWARRS